MKKLLATLMALAMTLTLCTVAFADTTVTTEEELKIAVATDGKIVLGNDITLTAPLCIDKNVTIDLNGKSITADTTNYGPNDDFILGVKRGGTLTIDDSGKTGLIDSGSNTALRCAIKMTVLGEGADGLKATLVVNGGTIAGDSFGIAGNGTRQNTSITINGGVIKCNGGEGMAIYHPQKGDLLITGGKLTGNTAVAMKAGTLTITGGTIEGTGSRADFVHSGNGFYQTGDALVVEACDYPGGVPVVVDISGGTFISENNKAVAYYQESEDYKLANENFISGGTFSTPVRSYVVPTLKYEASDGNGENYTYHGTLDEAVAAAGDTGYVDNISVNSNMGTFIVKYNDGTGREIRIYTSLAAPEVPTMTREGYTFKGWLINDGTTVYADLSNVEFSGDGATLTAVWEKIPARYYYNSTTTTTKDDTKTSPKTFDAGMGIYALTAVLSVTGMAYVGKKKF